MKSVPRVSTLVELLRYRAQATPDKVAYVFLKDGKAEDANLTYGELDFRARQIAAHLKEKVPAGSRVLINHVPGLDYISSFFGCLYASMVAIPVYPPRFNQKLDRLNSIVGSARPAAALTSKQIMDTLRPGIAEDAVLSSLSWMETDLFPQENISDSVDVPRAGDLAFLQYTSGSTSDPKGVMLSHGNLMSNLECIFQGFDLHSESCGVVWLPPYHDMGLIGGILEPAYGGFPIVLFSPFTFLQRPYRWLQAVSKYRATCTGGPNFAYELCTRRLTDEQMEGVDLSSVEVAFCGAEPIRSEMIEAFSDRFSRWGFRRQSFYPCYGLAEATLMVSGGKKLAGPIFKTIDGEQLENRGLALDSPRGKRGTRELVGCGEEVVDHKVRIVDPKTLHACEEGQVGEVWVSGPSVAQGYWQRPEDTESHFHARIDGDTSPDRYLRTGDLGFLKDKELFVTGRLKDLLIIHGRNLYPQDLELTVEKSHPSLRSGAGAAFAISEQNEEKLVVVQELERRSKEVDLPTVVQAIRTALMEAHGVPPFAISLIEPNSIPLTSSGKIQRHAARKLFLSGALRERGRFLEK